LYFALLAYIFALFWLATGHILVYAIRCHVCLL